MEHRGTVCIVGAAGFVGKAIALKLVNEGFKVRAVVRRPSDELVRAGLDLHILDISKDKSALTEAFSDSRAVFHVAAKVDMWGPYHEFYNANVLGTRNVIAACKEAGVSRLIYTSSPSVVADGNNLRNIDESYPIPERHLASYPATKAMAETEVLLSNCAALKTISLRPHLIFGPGDKHFIPTIVKRAKEGRLMIVGSGDNQVDVCFIEDCVQAHLCAYEALSSDTKADGKAYFISQGEPIKLWNFIDGVLKAHSLPPLKKRISKSVAMKVAGFFEIISKISPVEIKPLFTRFLVSEMSTDHYFNISAARNLLGYNPKYSVAQALEKSFPSVNP